MYIPKQICYISQPKESKDGLEYYPTFVCDAEKEASKQTGISWAKGYKNKKYTEVVNDNIPLYTYQIVDLEYRSEGGRAYKVILNDDHNFYVDLREDVLLDCIRDRGIAANGYILNGLIWAVLGSQTRLVMYGGSYYNEIVDSMKIRSTKTVPKRDLTVGNIYQDSKKDLWIYLGIVDNHETYKKNPNYTYGNDRYLPVILNDQQMWFKIASYEIDKINFTTDNEWLDFIGSSWYMFDFVKEKKVIAYNGNLPPLNNVDYIGLKDRLRKPRKDGTPKESIEKEISWVPRS
jgi:hypothetical protein